jgi:hypothetical protein
MKGGELKCRRDEKDDDGCIKIVCIDREKAMEEVKNVTDPTERYEIFNKKYEYKECDKKNGWKKYFDAIAAANYWYNWDSGEATWVEPKRAGGKSKTKRQTKKQGKGKTKRQTKRNAKSRKKIRR